MVLDTHIFIWYTLDDKRLPEGLKARLKADPEKAHVPSICLWEALLLVQRGRLKLARGNPSTRLIEYLRKSGFREAPLTAEIALLSRTLRFQHEDPADRFIGATAKALNMPLATVDDRLRHLPWLKLAKF